MDSILSALGGILLNAVPTFLLIILLHFYLKSAFFGPMEKVLHQREEATAGARKRAEEALANANGKLRQYDEMIQAARNEIYKDQEEIRRKLKADQDQQIAEASARSKQMIAEAREKIAGEAAAARHTLEAEARALASRITDQILDGRAA
ncbi:MAG: ATP synthase F0 subunit B [Bryobacteraceae bacterium]|nr:ATP synthase F0 subunit B [Bryobacteraceae bacterium]